MCFVFWLCETFESMREKELFFIWFFKGEKFIWSCYSQESYCSNSKKNLEKSEGLYHRQTSFPLKTLPVIFQFCFINFPVKYDLGLCLRVFFFWTIGIDWWVWRLWWVLSISIRTLSPNCILRWVFLIYIFF